MTGSLESPSDRSFPLTEPWLLRSLAGTLLACVMAN